MQQIQTVTIEQIVCLLSENVNLSRKHLRCISRSVVENVRLMGEGKAGKVTNFKDFIYVHVYECMPNCVCSAHESQKRALDPLELKCCELPYVSGLNGTQVHCKNNVY